MLTQLRQQTLQFWEHQGRAQRIALIGLVVAGLVLVPLFIAWASTPSYAVAFSGLSEADAGEIVNKLAADKTPYRVEAGGAILVPSNRVYEVRLAMARQGLPAGGTVGFELFSGTTLGMTEFTQRVNYQRALEGELERTIGSLTAVKAVRVHVVTPEKGLFASEQLPTTASITLQMRPGEAVDAAQVRAITHLVASAVEGLNPDHVVVVDVNGNLLAGGDTFGGTGASSQLDDRRAAEATYAAAIESKVRNLLDTVLGPNQSVVQASVALDWSQKDVTTQSFEPDPDAVRSSQTVSEVYSGDSSAVGGIPGADSNLPPVTAPAAEAGAATPTAYYQRTESTTNYELSQTQSHEVIAPGQVKRVSVSVLVDGMTDAQQLETLRTVIAAAAGVDTARGDSVAVETLAFDRSFYEAQAEAMNRSEQTDLYIKIGEAVAAALVLVALLWYVQRLLANLRLASAEAWTPVMVPASQAALGGPQAPSALPPADRTAGQALAAPPPAPKLAAPTPEDEQLQRVITRLAEENPMTVSEVIHLWLNEDEHRHG